ncbi:BatA domain-containing protein [Rufibacter sp. XAAS-G3-1]|uniref:BatA domain-containing protein n=1 Tax=Rufibacter sp. XAAS-G3-1 TaxID=2729134 RepID=UPI0015E695D6|nr:BatA domain-containing protein [Rufibacter sp. XAAS-G3-1]
MLPLLSGTAIAAVILIFIHFFGLRLRQRLDFSHIQFLNALISRTKSVRKINNYLLLFLRLLFVAAALSAVLLFLNQLKNNSSLSNNNAVVLVDTSWSMQSPSTKNGISKADLTLDVVSDVVQNQSSINRRGSTAQSGSSTSFYLPQEGIDRIENQRHSGQTYFLSDFQKSTFSPDILKSLPRAQAITLISLSSGNTSNLFIDSVWLEQPILMPNSLAGISIRVAGSNLSESSQIKVSASEGGQLVGATQVLLDPGQKATAHFKIPLNRNEPKEITFEVEDPVTTFDNQYFIVLPKPSAIQIRMSRAQLQKDPIVQAYKAEPAFTFSQKAQAPNSLWVLDIPTSGASSLVNEVKAWVEDGNSVVLIPTEVTQQATVDFLSRIGLRDVSVENQELGAKPLGQPDLSDAFFRQIFEKEVQNMKMPEAKPVLTWRSSFHTILKFTDNTPFLSTFRVGKGNVHLFASPINNASSFVAHPLFVPVMYQVALSSSTGKSVLSHQPNSGNISIPLEDAVASKQPYSLVLGQQSFIPDQRVRQNLLQMSLPHEVNKPGFYKLMREGKVVSTIAMNIPRAESRLEGYSVDELKELLAEHGKNIQVLEPEESISLQKQLQKEASGPSLWKYCLILCFLCLGLEAVILSTKKSGSPI